MSQPVFKIFSGCFVVLLSTLFGFAGAYGRAHAETKQPAVGSVEVTVQEPSSETLVSVFGIATGVALGITGVWLAIGDSRAKKLRESLEKAHEQIETLHLRRGESQEEIGRLTARIRTLEQNKCPLADEDGKSPCKPGEHVQE